MKEYNKQSDCKTYMDKWQALLTLLNNKKNVAIACSGGLDSRLLSYAASISGANYKILHIQGVHIPKEEEEILLLFSQKTQIPITTFKFNPLEIKEVKENDVKRCYYCKKAIFSFMLSQTEGYTLCDGSNTDDLNVYRPGMEALKELQIFSPYIEVAISKKDIRDIAKEVNLPLYSQPSQACLLTRFNYNITLNEEDILFLDKAEEALKKLIPYPFRLRGISENLYELHIESEYEDEQLSLQIENIFREINSSKSAKSIPIIFMPSLRAYFDKSLGL